MFTDLEEECIKEASKKVTCSALIHLHHFLKNSDPASIDDTGPVLNSFTGFNLKEEKYLFKDVLHNGISKCIPCSCGVLGERFKCSFPT